jgi:catechol-2,3-dioxygenase
MSTADVSTETATEVPGTGAVDMKLEVVVLPVTDADRAKQFYESLGWRLDADVATGEVFHDEGGVFDHAGTKGRVCPGRSSYGSWASFSDPDGNGWLLQEITTRLPGR